MSCTPINFEQLYCIHVAGNTIGHDRSGSIRRSVLGVVVTGFRIDGLKSVFVSKVCSEPRLPRPENQIDPKWEVDGGLPVAQTLPPMLPPRRTQSQLPMIKTRTSVCWCMEVLSILILSRAQGVQECWQTWRVHVNCSGSLCILGSGPSVKVKSSARDKSHPPGARIRASIWCSTERPL